MKTKTPSKARVREMQALSDLVGGPRGRMLMELAVAAANGGPDLSIRTRTAVSSQVASALKYLGGFDPDAVSIQTMKRMRLDPQIGLAMAATFAPILEAPVHFESTSREAVALCNQVYLDTGVLRALQKTSLQALEFGYAAHEVLWDVATDVEVTWGEPGATVGVRDTKVATHKTLFVPKQPKDLDPAMVAILQDEFGTFQGLVYGAQGALLSDPAQLKKFLADDKNYLPPEKCFLFTHNEEWSNKHGRGRHISSYDPWYWQRIIYLICNRWYERKSDPPYLGFAPSDPFLAAPSNVDAEDYDPDDEAHSPVIKLRRLIDNSLRSSGVMVLPSEPYKDDNGKPSTVRAYDLKELGVEDVHPAFLAYLQHLDVKKTRGWLVPDGAIASSEHSGTYGSTQALSALAVKIQNADNDAFVRAFNEYHLKRFLRYNGIKERVSLRTTGVSQDNRAVLTDLLDRVIESDMLLEQRWGPQFPESITRLVDRRTLLRSLDVPFDTPSPGAPPPELPEPPPAPESPGPDGSKRKTGLKTTRPLSVRRLDVASSDFVEWAEETAREFETSVAQAAAQAPYRRVVEQHEQAVAAILLWYLLRADKVDKAGKVKKGLPKVDRFVFPKGKVLPAERLARNLKDLEKIAMDYDGLGYRLAPANAASGLLAKAERAVKKTMDSLPADIEGAMPVNEYLAPAARAADVAARNLVERFDSEASDTFTGLTEAAVASLVALNVKGLLWNIQNITVREGRSATESLINAAGNRRSLGAIREFTERHFNGLYTSLSLEAHYRAVFRGVMADLAEANGYEWLLMVSAASTPNYDRGESYLGTIRTADEWDRLGEREGMPNPQRQFGFHHGSQSYWFPVPRLARQASRSVESVVASILRRGEARRSSRKTARA